MTPTTACIVAEPGARFDVAAVTLSAPQPDEVLVRIMGVGLCHTDLVVQAGHIPFPLPGVLGHEGAGIVEAVGDAVEGLTRGDHVVLSFRHCGACRPCRDGAPAYCRQFGPLNIAGVRPDGSATIHRGGASLGGGFFGQSSFAAHALAHRSNVVRVDRDLPIALLGPLGCGVQTGAGAVMRSLGCPAGSSILILGGGSVGLSAVLAAVVQGCASILVVEPQPARRALAIELGATDAIDPADLPIDEAVARTCADGVDFILDTTALVPAIAAAMRCLRPRGVCGLLGVARDPAACVSVPMASLIAGGHAIRGILEGDSDPQAFIPELLALYRQGRFPFDRLITTYPLAAINEAVADQHSGRCVKAVLLPEQETV